MKNLKPGRTVVVLDDDKIFRDLVAAMCTRQGVSTVPVADLASLQSALADLCPGALMVDLNLGDADGLEILEVLRTLGFDRPVIIFSGCEERVLRMAARVGQTLGLKIAGTLQKPFVAEQLMALLEPCLAAVAGIDPNTLREAIGQGKILPHYQPLVDIGSGRVRGAEALARWTLPSGRAVPPDEFIHVAESSGAMTELTGLILRQAATDCREWVARGHDIPVSVNVSPTSFNSVDFLDGIFSILDEVGLDRRFLKIEVTETVAMSNVDRSTALLCRLRIKGIELGLDDFGTGFSSLAALHRMPFSDIKIDKSFVMSMTHDPDARTIVKAIVDLAHNLGLRAVAEGVEDEACVKQLAQIGCDVGQGYHFSRPLAAVDFLDYLKRADGDKAVIRLAARRP